MNVNTLHVIDEEDDPDFPVASDTYEMPHFEEIILGERDLLVLMPRHHVDPETLIHMNETMPEHLRGRVLVIEDCDVKVVRDVRVSTD